MSTPEERAKHTAYAREWRKHNPERLAISKRRYAKSHPEQIQAAAKRYRERHGDRRRASGARYRMANLDKIHAKNREAYYEDVEETRAQKRAEWLARKIEVLLHYGGKCACCGEKRHEFLAIDHINGGGRKHVKETGGKLHRWLRQNNYPAGFRVLCHNCNFAFGLFGYCPHEKEIPTVVVSETVRPVHQGGGVESGYIGEEVEV